jgi:hypothetical protein
MRLAVVSNRLPFTVSFRECKPQVWLGRPGASVPAEHEAAAQSYAGHKFKSGLVFLPEESMIPSRRERRMLRELSEDAHRKNNGTGPAKR